MCIRDRAWFIQRYAYLPLTSKLIDAVVLACSLSLAILWQGELRRLMELLGTGRLAVLLGNPPKEFRATSTTIIQLVDAAGKLSKNKRGALIVVDLGSDLRPEDFLYSGTNIEAQLSTDLLINLFATDTPLHDGAVVVKGNKILNEGGLRSKKEFVNHKILDLAGDFMLSGVRVIGRVECIHGGHALTNKFLKKIFSDKSNYNIIESQDTSSNVRKILPLNKRLAVNA